MSKKNSILWWMIVQSLILASCSVNKHLPEDKYLYDGAKVNFVKFDDIKSEDLGELNYQLLEKTRPTSNSKLIYFYKVGFFYGLKRPKKTSGFFGKLYKLLVEEPVFFDSTQATQNAEHLKEFLIQKGYFQAQVEYELVPHKKKVSVQYTARLPTRYHIDSLKIIEPKDDFEAAFVKIAKEKLKEKTYFDLEEIKAKRVAIDRSLRSLGYYKFRPEYIRILTDSVSLGKNKIWMDLSLNPTLKAEAKKRFQINDIIVKIDQNQEDTLNADDQELFRGLLMFDAAQKYNPYLFESAIAFRPGNYYNRSLEEISNSRLLNLGNFREIKTHFKVVNQLDSSLVNIYYDLKSHKRQQIKLEANGITRSSGLAGTQITLDFSNRNIFKGAETLSLKIFTNAEVQIGGKKENQDTRDISRVGASLSANLPKLLVPFYKLDPEESNILPKTQFSIGYEKFRRKGLYDLVSFNFRLNYAWTKGRAVEQELSPVFVTRVRSQNFSLDFIEAIFSDPDLLQILENRQFIVGGEYQIRYKPKSKVNQSMFYNGGLISAGNLFSSFDGVNNRLEVGSVFNEVYSQFLQFRNELGYTYKFTPKVQLASRIFVGLGVPIGNSFQLPFVYQFYVGGNASLRGFRARGVGPGSYKLDKENIAGQYIGNNTGDVKLEANVEARFKINNFFNVALLTDFGNIWNYKDPYIYGEEALFKDSFYKQLAMDMGIGFRFDFSLMIFRLDLAFPTRIPSNEVGERFVFNQTRPLSSVWRRENLIWNIAIGLPF